MIAKIHRNIESIRIRTHMHTNKDTRTEKKGCIRNDYFYWKQRYMLIASQLEYPLPFSVLSLSGYIYMCLQLKLKTQSWCVRWNDCIYKIKRSTVTSQSLHEYSLAVLCCVGFYFEKKYVRFGYSLHLNVITRIFSWFGDMKFSSPILSSISFVRPFFSNQRANFSYERGWQWETERYKEENK